jgi:hypothetical protein
MSIAIIRVFLLLDYKPSLCIQTVAELKGVAECQTFAEVRTVEGKGLVVSGWAPQVEGRNGKGLLRS